MEIGETSLAYASASLNLPSPLHILPPIPKASSSVNCSPSTISHQHTSNRESSAVFWPLQSFRRANSNRWVSCLPPLPTIARAASTVINRAKNNEAMSMSFGDSRGTRVVVDSRIQQADAYASRLRLFPSIAAYQRTKSLRGYALDSCRNGRRTKAMHRLTGFGYRAPQ